ncbi:MAG: hypothetical protein ACXVDD_07190 [Polyangia bacterium]
MGRSWSIVLVCAALGVPTANAASTAAAVAPAATALAAADVQPIATGLASAPCPLDDDDSRDLDDDDDSDDDALLTGPPALELPRERRVGFRIPLAAFHAPPDTDELLRPPQLRID